MEKWFVVYVQKDGLIKDKVVQAQTKVEAAKQIKGTIIEIQRLLNK